MIKEVLIGVNGGGDIIGLVYHGVNELSGETQNKHNKMVS